MSLRFSISNSHFLYKIEMIEIISRKLLRRVNSYRFDEV